MRPATVNPVSGAGSVLASRNLGPLFPTPSARKGSTLCSWCTSSFSRSAKEGLKHPGKLFARGIGRRLRDDVETDVFGLDPVRPRELCVGCDVISKLEAIAQTGIPESKSSVADVTKINVDGVAFGRRRPLDRSHLKLLRADGRCVQKTEQDASQERASHPILDSSPELKVPGGLFGLQRVE